MISKALKQTFELLKVETADSLEKMKQESDVSAKTIADAGCNVHMYLGLMS